MTIKSKLKDEPGFQYIIDSLELMSAAGQRRMLHQEWIGNAAELEREYDRMDHAIRFLRTAEWSANYNTVRHQLMQMHDISGTLQSLCSHTVINEIELFEVKAFAQLYTTTYNSLAEIQLESLLLTDQANPSEAVRQAFSLLDPDGTGIATFYIYDSYDARLAPIRKELKLCEGNNPELFARQESIEREVVARLSDRLFSLSSMLSVALSQMSYLDFLLAKANLVEQWKLSRPCLSDGVGVEYTQIFNPRLRQRNLDQGLRYQCVDISLCEGVCLITGANMAGKTVLLKTVGIAQMMAQFGMFVPAERARVSLVEDVLFCIGDEQNEMNGLSSFASEIIKISNAVTLTQQKRLLILIDEPARTTNPVEGKAIVHGIGKTISDNNSHQSMVMMTTHYSQLGLDCRRLRVKGFVESMSDQPLTPQNINLFMDYSLLADDSDEVPQEALRIATILDCNPSLIKAAQDFLSE